MDALLAGASEEELIALAIAASLSESPSGGPGHGDRGASPRPATGCDDALSPGGRGFAGAPEDEPASWISLGSSPGTAARLVAGAWGKGAPRTSSRAAADSAEGSPSVSTPTLSGAQERAGEGGGQGEPQTPAKGDETQQYAEFIGTGHEECANEDESILGVPLSEIPAQRVVRFRIPLQGSSQSHAGDTCQPCSAEAGAPAHDPIVARTSDDAGGGSAGPPSSLGGHAHAAGATDTGKGGGRGGERPRVVHGYEAMALARWLLRDERLPLTSHRVRPNDVGTVCVCVCVCVCRCGNSVCLCVCVSVCECVCIYTGVGGVFGECSRAGGRGAGERWRAGAFALSTDSSKLGFLRLYKLV
jgi:hypothetical protein